MPPHVRHYVCTSAAAPTPSWLTSEATFVVCSSPDADGVCTRMRKTRCTFGDLHHGLVRRRSGTVQVMHRTVPVCTGTMTMRAQRGINKKGL